MRAVEKLLATKRLLTNLSRDFTPVAMFQTFSVEDMVLADLIYADLVHKEYSNISMFTIDTGRLPEESHRLMEQVRDRYGDVLRVYYPDATELEQQDVIYGVGKSFQDRSNRVRFLKPLQRALNGHKAWITGSDALNDAMNSASWIAWDETHQLPRFNPLSRWTREEVWSYSKHHSLPVHGYLHTAEYGRSGLAESGLWWWQAQPDTQEWGFSQNIA